MRSSNDKRIVSGTDIRGTNVKTWDAHRFDAKTENVGIDELSEVEIEGLKRAKEKREIEQLRKALQAESLEVERQKKDLDAQYAEMLAKAKSEAEILRAEAQQQGYADGFEKSEQERQTLIRAVESFALEHRNLNVLITTKMKELAVLVAQKIVGDTAKLHHENAIKNMEILLQETRLNPEEITIRVHPDTHSVIKTHLLETPTKKALSSIHWILDDKLLPTGMIIEHQFGEVDFSLESRWKRVLSHFDLDDTTNAFLARDLAPSEKTAVRTHSASTSVNTAHHVSPRAPSVQSQTVGNASNLTPTSTLEQATGAK